MFPEDKDRLFEILLYLYFANIPEKYAGTAEFWNLIKSICGLYNISDTAIIRAVRVLTAKENIPTDDETWFLLNQMGLTVRPIRTISGIYWQKQKEFSNKYESKRPHIYRRVTDIIMKKAIRDFIFAMYESLGVFAYVDIELLKKIA